MSSIQIIDRQSGDVVEAELVSDPPPDELLRAEKQYRDLRHKRKAQAAAEGQTPPQHSDWNWTLKVSSSDKDAYRCFGIRHDGSMQGLMMLAVEPQQSRRPDYENQRILYLEFIETAPWNQRLYAETSPRFAGVGTQLLRVAIQISVEAGCEGRIGLHSLPQSEGFYRPNFHDLGVDPAEDLRYFEMSEEQALRLLRGQLP